MKIAIAGYGVEGEANYRYWSTDPSNQLTIVDESLTPKFDVPEGAKTLFGPGAFEKLDGFDLVVRTAGLSPFKIITDGKVWSATNEFFEKCPAKIIGVTGTKGKGTTSTMIAAILEAAGKKVWLVGNIGTAALEVLDQIQPNDIVVYELSSFQLWDIERSPHIAVVLGIEAEHLDVHKDMKDYVDAKGRIRRFQTVDDIAVYHPTNDYARLITLANHEAPMMRYAVEADGGVYVRDKAFYEREHKICSIDILKVPGVHNVENACAAITVARRLHVSDEEIIKGLSNFVGLPHRLEEVATVEGVTYYNDSFSSNPSATYAAIRAFERPEIVIMGGVDRGADFEQFAADITGFTNLKEIVLIGEIRHKLEDILTDLRVDAKITVLDVSTMREIVDYVHTVAASGDVVLLSPGCASFDMFKDFYDRGDQFRQIVKSLSLTNRFVFRSYEFDAATKTAHFRYGFEDGRRFEEKIIFDAASEEYDRETLDRALFLSFILIGTSYYKAFPSREVVFAQGVIDDWQAGFLNKVYGEGLSQYAFENGLTREDLPLFAPTGEAAQPVAYGGRGIVALQSGGKDSLLTATLLNEAGVDYLPWYLGTSEYHPKLLDDLGRPLVTARRVLDLDALKKAQDEGGKNGHVPVTYIVQSLALVQAILAGKNEVLVSIAHEGEEPHAMIGDLPVTHQWSKTWGAEQLFAEYLERYVSPDVRVGSPLRAYSELRVAELFFQHAWDQFGGRFSSCNRANYRQQADNSELHWCGECPKCANAFLLFAPFVDAETLTGLFAGQDLFAKPMLQETFKGLLGIDGVMKPFECVGEIDELRYAYHQAQQRGGYQPVSFEVPTAVFDYLAEHPAQDWARLPR